MIWLIPGALLPVVVTSKSPTIMPDVGPLASSMMRAIPPLPGDVGASLDGINNWGSAVGQSAQAMGPPRGVISRFGRPLVDLNTLLDPATRGNWFVFAAGGINDYGQIIAVAFDTTSPMPGGTHVLLTPIYR